MLEQVPDVMMTFDFSTTPWTLDFANLESVFSANSAEGRLSRNVESARIIYDDSELCTRVYYEHAVSGSEDGSTEWEYMDADTISTYGLVEREVSTGGDYTAAEATRVATEYLRKHKNPKITIEISAEDLSGITSEPLDAFVIGKLFRLQMTDYGISVEKNITAMSWDDVYGDPQSITVNLADPEDTAISYIHNTSSSGSGLAGGGGGGSGKKKQDDLIKDHWTNIIRNDYQIKLEAYARTYGDNLNYSYIDITANYIRSEVANTACGLHSEIVQEANRISLVVEGTGSNAYVRPASIIGAITDSGGVLTSSITIDADNVYIGNQKSTTVIAGKCELSDVSATYIETLFQSTAFSISGGISCGSITSTGTIDANGAISGTDFQIRSTSASLTKAIKSIGTATASGGNVSIPTTRLDGTSGDSINFNIATTQYYIDGVASARATGYQEGSPSSGTAGGRTSGVSALVHDFTITRNDGTTKVIQIDCTSIYSTARTGYTYGTFTQATVTPQGEAQAAYVVDSESGSSYYLAGSSQTYYEGNGQRYTSATRYTRSNGMALTKWGTGTLYPNPSGTGGMNHTWWYESGSTYYYKTSSETVYIKSGTGDIYARGDSVSVKPVTGSALKLKSVTRYKAGTPDSTTYYTKS